MKKKILILFLIVCIIIFGMIFAANKKNKDKSETIICNNKYELLVNKLNDNKFREYNIEDIKVFTYNLDFENYLKNINTINDLKIEDNYDLEDIMKDGGSEIYISKKCYSNISIKIIKCNTIEGNSDIYIGLEDMSNNVCSK